MRTLFVQFRFITYFCNDLKAPVMGCDHSEAKVGLTRPRLHIMCFKIRNYFLFFQTYLV